MCVQSHLKTITMAIMRALNGDNSEGKSYFFETDRIMPKPAIANELCELWHRAFTKQKSCTTVYKVDTFIEFSREGLTLT